MRKPIAAIVFATLAFAQNVTFERSDLRDWGRSGQGQVVSGDFNRDGRIDLVQFTRPDFARSEMVVRLGKGDGTFQEVARTALAGSYYSAVAADFNGDGNLDLAAAPDTDPVVFIWLGNGQGSFAPAPPVQIRTRGPGEP